MGNKSSKDKKRSTSMRAAQGTELFSWGDDSPMHSLFDFTEVVDNGRYFEPPVNQKHLTDLLRRGVHHASAIGAKVNILSSTFKPTALLSRIEFEKTAFNFLVTGNAYIEAVRNKLHKPLYFQCRLSVFMRRASDLENYIMLRSKNGKQVEEKIIGKNVAHIMQPDLRQEVYGSPYYLSCLDSIELNQSATRFRRRYYDNGSHAGFLIYSVEDKINEEDWEHFKQQLRQSRGTGNFKNLVLRAPGGNKDGIQLMPISEVAAKDEFINIKSVSADDMLAIHRVPPKLMGIIPKTAGSLGDAETDAKVFAVNEIYPLQQKFMAVNDQFGEKIFDFDKYSIGVSGE